MKSSMLRFIGVGLLLCLVFGIIAPFVASSDPDGLESAAEGMMGAEGLESQVESYYEAAPFPDYVVPALGEEAPSSALSMVIGVIAMFMATWAVVAVVVRTRGE